MCTALSACAFYTIYFKYLVKQRRLVFLGRKLVGKFCAVVRLNAFDPEFEAFYHMCHKYCGVKLLALFIKGLKKPVSGIFVYRRILIELFTRYTYA